MITPLSVEGEGEDLRVVKFIMVFFSSSHESYIMLYYGVILTRHIVSSLRAPSSTLHMKLSLSNLCKPS